jgi:mannosyltransferase OCH1-like enzyme
MIPKIIHQTWKTLNVPDEWKDAVESCKNIHKDYKHNIWSHEMMEKFVKQEYPDFYNTYMSYKYDIQRCDSFRYLVLYKYGGIYLDMDIVCKKNLDSFLEYDFVIAKSSNISNLSYTNMFFMVIPNHPFIKFCIDNLPKYINSYSLFGKHLHVMNSTGPSCLTKMMKKYQEKNIKNMYVITNKEFYGDCNICNEGSCNGGIYFSHSKGQSWNSFDSQIYNFLFCNQKKIINIVIISLIIYYIYYKNKNNNNTI